MDEKELNRLLSPPVPAEPSPELLAKENELWERLMEAIEEDSRHKEYFGFILRNNLLKQASRRYGELVEAKDRFSVQERRLARNYQQQIVQLLFLHPKSEARISKTSTLWAVLLFFFTFVMLGGLMSFFADTSTISPIVTLILKTLFPLGMFAIVLMIWLRIKKVTEDKDQYDSLKPKL